MKEMGALPSRCSGAAQTIPKLAREAHIEEYVLKLPPRPWEKMTTGYLEVFFLGSRVAFGVAGMEVYLIKVGSREMKDERRELAPKKEEYASTHCRWGDGSQGIEPVGVDLGVG
jgi:hypothetical protein